jgi:uncharacterized alpha-E superfamily protein
MTYRRRYMTSLQAAPVLDLLMADESNPRSVAFQLVRLTEHVEALPRPGALTGGGVAKRSMEEKILLRTLTGLRLTDMQAESQATPVSTAPRRDHLDRTILALANDLLTLSDTLSQTYLSHAFATRQLGNANPRAEP